MNRSVASSALQAFEVVETRGGFLAVRDRASGEVMHPVGPLDESERLYAGPARLAERAASLSRPLVVYDVGLGAGSNAVAAWRRVEAGSAGAVEIISFDRTTEALELALRSEHRQAFGWDGELEPVGRALLADGRVRGRRTTLSLVLGALPGSLVGQPPADVVFWDPFSPRANPELWTVAAFRILQRRCGDAATVHTYSASTRVRSAMLLAGFAVGLGAATGAKRNTTMAATRASLLPAPLGRRWLSTLSRSSAPLPADAPADAMERIAALPQFHAAGS